MARHAADLALLLDVLVSPSPIDESFRKLQPPRPTKTALKDYRIAVWAEQPPLLLGAEVRAALGRVTQALQKAGAGVHPDARPDFDASESHGLVPAASWGHKSIEERFQNRLGLGRGKLCRSPHLMDSFGRRKITTS